MADRLKGEGLADRLEGEGLADTHTHTQAGAKVRIDDGAVGEERVGRCRPGGGVRVGGAVGGREGCPHVRPRPQCSPRCAPWPQPLILSHSFCCTMDAETNAHPDATLILFLPLALTSP